MSIFGAIQVATDLEDAVVTTLSDWFPVYLREYERQAGLVADNVAPLKHPLPQSYLRADKLDREAASALPAIVVVSPGLSGRSKPSQEGDGSFNVPFNIAAGVFVGSNLREDTMRLVRVYTAICRTIMLQKQSFGGFANGSAWVDESYDDDFPFPDGQTISAGQVIFEVWVAGVVNRFGGPAADPDPATQPGSEWPLAETVTATVEPKE
jgi:hypothetical protein